MTKHKIDDLFNEKLAGSEFAPSPVAWSKLESQLAQKKKKGIIFWMSMAASVALLLTFGWLVFGSEEEINQVKVIAENNNEPTINIAPSDTVQIEEGFPVIDNNIMEENTPEKVQIRQKNEVEKQAKSPIDTQNTKIQKSNTPLIIIQQKSNLAVNKSPEEVQKDILETADKTIADVLDTNKSIATNTPVEQIKAPSKESGSIKLVYTLKPSVSTESIAQGTKKEKNSPFKKVVTFAKNVKENPKGIGHLRNAKNNFLSFNKKKNDSK